MKNKLLILLLLVVSVSLISCDKENTETTTKADQETTFESVNQELDYKLDVFNNQSNTAEGIIVSMRMNMDIYYGGNTSNDLLQRTNYNFDMMIDQVNPYIFLYEYSGGYESTQALEEKNGELYLYTLSHDILNIEKIDSVNNDDYVNSFIGDYELVSEDVIDLIQEQTVVRHSNTHYSTTIGLGDFLSKLDELDDFSIDLTDYEGEYIETSYEFSNDFNTVTVTTHITPFLIDDATDTYLGLKTVTTLINQTELERIEILYDECFKAGPDNSDTYLYVFEDYSNAKMYLRDNSSNHYTFYFEPGYYLIYDNEWLQYNEITIKQYQEDNTIEIIDTNIIEIPEAGYYDFDYCNNSGSDIKFIPKISKMDIGTPNSQQITTSSTLDLSANDDFESYMFFSNTDNGGILVLKDEDYINSGFTPLVFCKGAVDYVKDGVKYYAFLINNDTPVVANFVKNNDKDSIFSWEFIPFSWSLVSFSNMRTYDELGVNFMFLDKHDSEECIRFTLTEDSVVTFNIDNGYYFYDNPSYFDLYRSTGFLVESNIIGNTYNLPAGNYYFKYGISGTLDDEHYFRGVFIITLG